MKTLTFRLSKSLPLFALFLLLTAPFSSFATAEFPGDETDGYLVEYNRNGISLLKQIQVKGVKASFYITKNAQMIIDDKNFDVEDNGFSTEQFQQNVTQKVEQSLAFLLNLIEDAPLAELHIIIEDLGEARRGTISGTRHNTRITALDIRRWHKLLSGDLAFLADMSAVHELAHVLTYGHDSAEEKLHRELISVIVESSYLMKIIGEEKYFNIYPKLVGQLPSDQVIFSDSYSSMSVPRGLAHQLVNGLYQQTYSSGGQTPEQLLARFAMAYLKNSLTGKAGFDQSMHTVGIKTKTGQPLSLDLLRRDLSMTSR